MAKLPWYTRDPEDRGLTSLGIPAAHPEAEPIDLGAAFKKLITAMNEGNKANVARNEELRKHAAKERVARIGQRAMSGLEDIQALGTELERRATTKTENPLDYLLAFARGAGDPNEWLKAIPTALGIMSGGEPATGDYSMLDALAEGEGEQDAIAAFLQGLAGGGSFQPGSVTFDPTAILAELEGVKYTVPERESVSQLDAFANALSNIKLATRGGERSDFSTATANITGAREKERQEKNAQAREESQLPIDVALKRAQLLSTIQQMQMSAAQQNAALALRGYEANKPQIIGNRIYGRGAGGQWGWVDTEQQNIAKTVGMNRMNQLLASGMSVEKAQKTINSEIMMKKSQLKGKDLTNFELGTQQAVNEYNLRKAIEKGK